MNRFCLAELRREGFMVRFRVGNARNRKVALVTGASHGIGRAIAIALAEAGADIGGNYRTLESEAEKVCVQIESFARRSVAVKGNVSAAAEVFRMVEVVDRELEAISILVNNAGIALPQPVEEITEE